MSKRILMIAGPNGAGKTSLARALTKNSSVLYEFINADEIARGLAPLHPESVALAASKLMIRRMQELLRTGKNFAFETTASGSNYVKHLKWAKSNGYEIHLIFLWLITPEHAVRRVAKRVKQGGHNIPKDTIIRRYFAGIRNLFTHYLPICDRALIMNNSGDLAKTIATKKNSDSLSILDESVWKQIKEGLNER